MIAFFTSSLSSTWISNVSLKNATGEQYHFKNPFSIFTLRAAN